MAGRICRFTDLQQAFYRMYDAALGRFVGVDPMAEGTDELSVYHYAANNPISFNDPMGDLVNAIQEGAEMPAAVNFSGGYRRIGAGSGNNWYGGMFNIDWNPWDGSAIYRAGLAAGFEDIGGDLYYSFEGKRFKVSYSGTGQVGYEGYGYKIGDDAGEATTNDEGQPFIKAVDTFEQIRFWFNFTSGVQDRFSHALEKVMFGNNPLVMTSSNDNFFRDYYDTGSKIKFVQGILATAVSSNKLFKASRVFEFVNPIMLAGSVVLDYAAYREGEISGGKFALNTIMGLVGLTKIGAPISAIYFGVDAFVPGGWSGVGESLSNGLDQLVRGINGYKNIYRWVPHQ